MLCWLPELRTDMGWVGAAFAAAHSQAAYCALPAASQFVWPESGDWPLEPLGISWDHESHFGMISAH